MSIIIVGKEISVSGKLFRTARLRHEWCDFLDEVPDALQQIKHSRVAADLFTFVEDIGEEHGDHCCYTEPAALAVLPVASFQKWWDEIGFKARNKVRKWQKCGVELREVQLDDDFARGVEAIYNETPVRQGRSFYHYGKMAAEIRVELSSFLDRCIFIGAYHQGELIGFMKLLPRKNVLRTIHIIAKISHRDKCVMDALIGRAVEICDQRKIGHLHYGSWADGGVGDFRAKHGFKRVEVPRYFLPLNLRGRMMLKFKLHHPIRERLPERWIGPLKGLRTRLNSMKHRPAKGLVSS
jgi:hypothetical protein